MTYYVRQNAASPQDGTQEHPFSTISQAAAIAVPGDEILIGEGVYREWVDPPRGGTDDAHRITYRAMPGTQPVLSGAQILRDWICMGEHLYRTQIPRADFGNYCPYEDTIHGDWFGPALPRHYTGEIFADGQAFFQAPDPDHIDQTENPTRRNSWYAESDGETVTIWVYIPDSSPADHVMEASFRPHALFPSVEKINYISVCGLVIENVATQWAPPTAFQAGAIGPNWSRGWIIENCTVRNCKCAGISLGKRREESDNLWTRDPAKGGAQTYTETIFTNLRNDWNRDTVGSHIVRNNVIYNCGQTGIVGCMGAAFSTIEGNHIYQICNRGEFGGAEVAGIKLHAAIDVLIRHNTIHDCIMGLWLDWQAQGARVSGNAFFKNILQDIFIEVCHGPTTIDHNLLLSPTSLLSVSQGIAYAHNLFAGRTVLLRELRRFTMYHFPHETAILGSMIIYGGDDKVYNNVYVGRGDAERYGTVVYNGYSDKDYRPDTSAADYPITEDGLPSLAVFIRDNAYLGGAASYEHEIGATVYDEATTMRVVCEDGVYYLESNLPDALFSDTCERVTTALLGTSFQSGAAYENADGTPLVLDTDFCGNHREVMTAPGPFTKPISRLRLNR